MMMPDAVMLFAAGFGTRMRPLTDTRPKPLVEVAGTTLLDHAIHLVDEAGIDRKVVNLHYRGDQIRGHLADRDVLFSDETDRLRDTGGGLKHALPLFGNGPVFTMNTDAVWRGPNPFDVLRAAWDSTRMAALLLLVPPERVHGNPGGDQLARDAEGRLSRGAGEVYTGAQIVMPGGLAKIKDEVFSLNRYWDMLRDDGGLFGVSYPGEWCDVGQPESIPLAAELLRV